MPKIYSDDKKQAIKAKLMHEALNCIRNEGYKQLRIEDLTKKVGIAQGTFYHFFKSKESLLVELALAYQTFINERVHEIIRMKGSVDKGDFALLYQQMFLSDEANVFRYLKRADIEHLMSRLPVETTKLMEASRTTMLTTLEHISSPRAHVNMQLAFNLIQVMNIAVENRDLLVETAYKSTIHLLVDQLVEIVFNTDLEVTYAL